jgi:hypothetical protein
MLKLLNLFFQACDFSQLFRSHFKDVHHTELNVRELRKL